MGRYPGVALAQPTDRPQEECSQEGNPDAGRKNLSWEDSKCALDETYGLGHQSRFYGAEPDEEFLCMGCLRRGAGATAQERYPAAMRHLIKLIAPLPGEPRDDQDVAVPPDNEVDDAVGSRCRDQARAVRPLGKHLMGDTLGGRMLCRLPKEGRSQEGNPDACRQPNERSMGNDAEG